MAHWMCWSSCSTLCRMGERVDMKESLPLDTLSNVSSMCRADCTFCDVHVAVHMAEAQP